MRKLTMYAGLAALAIAVPAAQANDQHPNNGKKGNPPGQAKEHKSGRGEDQGKHQGQAKKPDCSKPLSVGYNARGTLVSSALTQTKGQDTAKKGDDRWSGDVTVNVTKANHRAPKGEQTFTLTNARVFSKAAPKAGDRVRLHGKVTRLRHGCDATGFTPQVTVRHVHVTAPKAPKPEAKKKS